VAEAQTERGEARAKGLPDAKEKREREELEKAQKPYRRGARWCKALMLGAPLATVST